MKRLFLLVVIVAMLLPSCKKINEAIDDLDNRLNKLEQETIPSIDEQISAINTTLGNLDAMDKELKGYIDNLTTTASSLQEQINATNTKIGEVKAELKGDIASTNSELKGEIATAKADVLAQLEALETELKNELAQINATIETLKAKDAELDNKIAELRSYVDTELGKTTDWVNATFATLEQYNALVSEVATIKEQIKAINQSIADLETRLTTKINEDIANAVSTLNADIQQKVKDITDAYTNAVKTAKEEITSAYTTAIQTAITTLDNSLKSWVGEQLSNYYTIAQIDAKLAALSAEFEGKLSTQKIYLESLISSLSQTLTNKIASNGELMEGLRNSLTSLSAEVAKNAEAIANNAEKISENASAIIENSKAIVANGENIEANKGSIEANTKLIAENKLLIEEVETKIDNTSNGANATAIANNAKLIADNAKAIADNAELIAQNSVAINNNAVAIANNATEIANLKTVLTTVQNEITEGYKKAIQDAIDESNGVINTKIANEVTTLNSRIDNEVATINNALNALTARVSTLENEVSSIKNTIASMQDEIAEMQEQISALLSRIQSITYVPKYSDGKADLDYNTKTVELDYQISPKSAISDLSKVWESALAVKTSYAATRAVAYENTPIVSYSADVENATVTVTVSLENLDNDFFNGYKEASMALQITDGNNFINSDYTIVYDRSNYEIRYTTSDESIITAPTFTNVMVLSNLYRDGEGIITYSKPINKIPNSAFSGKTKLTSIKLSHIITSIGSSAFYGCTSLTSITIPDSVTSIGNSAFRNCTSLTSITIPDSVTSIRDSAFSDCSSTQYVNIGSGVTSIGTSAFSNCTGVLTVNCDIPSASSSSDGTFYNNRFTEVIIGEKNKIIGDYAFSASGSDISAIKSVTIGNGTVSIGAHAFYYCQDLQNVVIGESVISIGDYAFYCCTSLTSATIPNNVVLINDGAFGYCEKLASITIGDGVTNIGMSAFGNCPKLKSIYCKALIPPAIYYNYGNGKYGSFSFNSGMQIYVPLDSYALYTKYTTYNGDVADPINWYGYKSYIAPYDFEE